MWQVERHLGRYINVGLVGEGLPGIKKVQLSGFYMIKDSISNKYVHDSNGIYPKKWDDFQEAVNFCAFLIEQDFPEEAHSVT